MFKKSGHGGLGELILFGLGFVAGTVVVASVLQPRIERLENQIQQLRAEQQELAGQYYNSQVRNDYEHAKLLQRIQQLQTRIIQLEYEKQIEQAKAATK